MHTENECALAFNACPLLNGRAAAVASPAAKRRIRSARRLYRGSARSRAATPATKRTRARRLVVRSLSVCLRSALLDPPRHRSVGLGLDMVRGEPRDVQRQARNSAGISLLAVISGPTRKIDRDAKSERNSTARRFRLFLSKTLKFV